MLLSIRTSGSSFLDNIAWYLAVFSCLAFVKFGEHYRIYQPDIVSRQDYLR